MYLNWTCSELIGVFVHNWRKKKKPRQKRKKEKKKKLKGKKGTDMKKKTVSAENVASNIGGWGWSLAVVGGGQRRPKIEINEFCLNHLRITRQC